MSEQPRVISLVNLGCAKNLVDSERILGALAEKGFYIAADPAEAEICLVNTCGFIQPAREETAGVLAELHALKALGNLKTIVALGCMVERAADAQELSPYLQHADARLGFKDFPRIVEICETLIRDSAKVSQFSQGPGASAAKKKVPKSYNDFLIAPRLRIGAPHSAFLKISEGCNNPCKFCAIPRMRGLQVSRPIEDLVKEAQQLIEGGAVELNLIAQDTTSYGQDLYGRHRLADLLRALREGIQDDVWLRLMYAYPKHLDAEMLEVLASDPRFCPYIDMPLQHISDAILTRMQRMVTKDQTLRLLDLIAQKLPNGALRTTFIVGYPGETDADFEEVLELVREKRFTHAGAFIYSHEPLTPAARLNDDVPLAVKQARRDALMLEQQAISREQLKAWKNREIEVLVDGELPSGSGAPKGTRWGGRTQREAPEVDGMVYLNGKGIESIEPGTRLQAKVTRTLEYDLVASVVIDP